jgi:hypothetical protein
MAASIPKIRIRLLKADIQDVGQPGTGGDSSRCCVAVGHYIGVKPVAAEKALTRRLATSCVAKPVDSTALGEAGPVLLTQLTERGIIRGELGQPFFLDDPRTRDDDDGAEPDRLIAIAGMGYAGRFGPPN